MPCSEEVCHSLLSNFIWFALLQQESEGPAIFNDKTLPTSAMLSLLGWSLSQPRATAEVRSCSFTFLENLFKLCVRLGDFMICVWPLGISFTSFRAPIFVKFGIVHGNKQWF